MPLRLQKYIRTTKQPTTITTTQFPTSQQKYFIKTNTPPPNLPIARFGFVIVRCITNRLTSKYWYKSYQSIRRFYPDTPIVIIDDNSKPMFINHRLEKTLSNCQIIQSEHPCAGEILGYYYFLKYKWFEKAVVIHDSVFIHDLVDFEKCGPVRFIWHIETKVFDNIKLESDLLKKIGGPYLGVYEDKNKWKGCFGVMAVIGHDFLKQLGSMFNILDEIKSREYRCCMERIFAVMCFHHHPQLMTEGVSIMGDIHKYPLGWGHHFTHYEKQEQRKHKFPSFVKVWTGR